MVCYEDLMKDEEATVRRIHEFLYNGTNVVAPATRAPAFASSSSVVDEYDNLGSHVIRSVSRAEAADRHGTSHDAALRQRLTELIQWIDARYYDGDIAWLNSALPC